MPKKSAGDIIVGNIARLIRERAAKDDVRPQRCVAEMIANTGTNDVATIELMLDGMLQMYKEDLQEDLFRVANAPPARRRAAKAQASAR